MSSGEGTAAALQADAEGSGTEVPFHGETYTVSATIFSNLIEMGFSETAIKKSIIAGCINETTCSEWIGMHVGHPELEIPIDESLVRVVVKTSVVLSDEERAAKVEELKEKIRLQKLAEAESERKREIENEKRRIEMGRLALEQKELREAQMRAQAFEERRKEKEADAIAREKAQLSVAIDRLVRQGKSEDEARQIAREELEEKKKRQREEAAEKIKQLKGQADEAPTAGSTATAAEWNLAALVGSAGDSKPQRGSADKVLEIFSEPHIPGAAPTRELFQSFCDGILTELSASPTTAPAVFTMLRTIIANVVDQPFDMKKRTLKVSSTAFSTKVAVSSSALRFLRACRFELVTDAEGQQNFIVMNTAVMRTLYRALEALP